jgi:hypothetical protein
MEFRTETDARRFEKYLKTGSGRAFAKRHLTTDLNPTTKCDEHLVNNFEQPARGRSFRSDAR